ncbi:RNA-binding domain-containing protein [Sorangium cellulosum]|nr:RNA-binding domain-containing protein [Sorangium cellulosum]
MFNKPVTELTKEDIDALVENEVPESKVLDYKGDLPTENKDFAADVAAFANAAGGFIIFGVPEKKDADGKRTGIPASADGIPGLNSDEVIRRLEAIVRTNIDPKLSGLHWHTIPGFPKGPILILHIPRSWSAPHMLTVGESRFPSRNDRNKVWLDVREIRSAFVRSTELPALIHRFRDERLGKIIAGATPIKLKPRAKLVLHLVPFASVSEGAAIDLATWGKRPPAPLGSGGWDSKYNNDGFISYRDLNEGLIQSYLQVFRTGALETVTTLRERRPDGLTLANLWWHEEDIIDKTKAYLERYREAGLELPLIALVSLLDAKGLTVPESGMRDVSVGMYVSDRDTLLLPNVQIQDYGDDALPKLFKPAFDALWQSLGFPRSFCYDKDGIWNGEDFRW